jgi:predicted lipoprotein
MQLKKTIVVFCSLVSSLLISCTRPTDGGLASPTGSSADREELLIQVADQIIVPSYALGGIKVDSLVKKSKAFTDVPSQQTLDDLRSAWEEAYLEWQKVALFDVGPAYNHTLHLYMNTYPASVAKINNNIASGTANLQEAFSYDAQGFPALDYLINGAASSDQAILDLYTTASDAVLRINYLKRLTSEINTKFDQVHTEWTTGYRDEFVSKTSTGAGSSSALLVNGYSLNYERYIRSGKIGIPAGALVSYIPSLNTTESLYRKDLSLRLLKAAHQASSDFFNGKSVLTGIEGSSFKTYLIKIGANDTQTGASLATLIGIQFQLINDRIDLLGPVLYDDITDEQPKIKDVFDAMQKLVRLVKLDMSSSMSITISYTDNDGD